MELIQPIMPQIYLLELKVRNSIVQKPVRRLEAIRK